MNKLFDEYKRFNNLIIDIIKKGVYFCLILSILSIFILIIYNAYPTPNLFYIGISLLKSAMFYSVSFIVFGFLFNNNFF